MAGDLDPQPTPATNGWGLVTRLIRGRQDRKRRTVRSDDAVPLQKTGWFLADSLATAFLKL